MKSSPHALTFALALLGGAIAGATSVHFMGASLDPVREEEALAGPELALAARIDTLVTENEALRNRLDMLELLPASSGRSNLGSAASTGESDFVTREEFDVLRKKFEKAGAVDDRTPAESIHFKDQVAGALDTIRMEQRVAKVRGNQERWLEQLDQRMPKIEGRLGLNASQSNQMRSALLAQYDRDQELIRRWEAGEDDAVLGEEKASNAEAFQADLTGFLTGQQLEQFQSFQRQGNGK